MFDQRSDRELAVSCQRSISLAGSCQRSVYFLLKKQQQFYTTGKLELDHINYKQVIAEIYKDSLQLINKEGTKKLKSSTRTLENFTSYSQGSEETVDIHSSYTRQKYMTLVILRTVNVTER